MFYSRDVGTDVMDEKHRRDIACTSFLLGKFLKLYVQRYPVLNVLVLDKTDKFSIYNKSCASFLRI